MAAIAIAVLVAKGRHLLDIFPLLFLVVLMSALPVMFTVSMAVGLIELARRARDATECRGRRCQYDYSLRR